MMKKSMVFLLAFLIAFVPGPMPASLAGQPESTTVMMYMCGTDLQSDCVRDIYEMCSVSLPETVTVAVQAGGAAEWDDEDLMPEAINRFSVAADGAVENLHALPGSSMGDKDTLLSFISWAAESFPADRYMLVLWDHGGGSVSGICFDETADFDSLTIHEINDALYEYTSEHPDFHFDIIGCDACLMATYELAAHLSPYATYMVASEELEPSLGWNYLGWLGRLAEEPDMPSAELAKTIADSFMEACLDDNPNDFLSQSVVYLPAVPSLVEQMEAYAAHLYQALDNGRLSEISRARHRMYAFGSFDNESSDQVDLMAFLEATRHIAPEAAELVEKAYGKAVYYSTGTETFDYLSGLSILLPNDNTDELMEDFDAYACMERMPNYSHLIGKYTALLSGHQYNFQMQPPVQVTPPQAAALEGMLSTAFLPGMTYPGHEETWPDTSVLGEKPAYAYTMNLKAEELQNLSLVEGLLFMDASDGENSIFVELGAMQNAAINWQTGEIISAFDGKWPMLEDQLVVIYDQIHSPDLRRSVVPVTLNGTAGYLALVFTRAQPEGVIVGFSAGYDEHSVPTRGLRQLKEGDVIVPTYPMLYEDADGELADSRFEGDPITVGSRPPVFSFESLEGSESRYLYCFRLTDIFGQTQLSDMIDFEL